MAKIFTCESLEMGILLLEKDILDDVPIIHINQGYKYLDINGEEINQLDKSLVSFDIAIAGIPTSIKSALQTITNFMKTKAYEKEGMTQP